jgi:hypothetical protein
MTLASSAVVIDGFKLKNVSKWEGESPYFGVHCGERSWGLPIYSPPPPPPTHPPIIVYLNQVR